MAVSSDVGGKLLAWLMAGAGTLLAYSAYRNRAPWDVLRDVQGASITTPRLPTGPAGQSFSFGSIPRIRMIANREIPPVLVPIQPCGQLDQDAAASKGRIDKKLGFVVKPASCGDAYRPYDVQAAGYARDPNRFANPNKGLHVVGLAFDIHQSQNNPVTWAAFVSEGWHQARPIDEPWHWSYGVRG